MHIGTHTTLFDVDPAEVRRLVATLMRDATAQLDSGNPARAALAAQTLAGLPRAAVDLELRAMLDLLVESAWSQGWQPTDLVHVARRRFGVKAVGVLVDAIAGQMRRYATGTIDPGWSRQLSLLDARVWWSDDDRWLTACASRARLSRTALLVTVTEVVAVLARLRPIPQLCPPPGQGSHTGDAAQTSAVTAHQERILRKVRALLAKAESTDYPEEAETLSAQAQQLIAKYSIDAAMACSSGPAAAAPRGRRIGVDNPYESPKVSLLGVVADANRCRAVWHKQYGLVAILGFAADLDAVELLFTSLLVQATAAMTRAGSRRGHDGRCVTRSFRHSFLLAYAQRIGERLRATAADVTADAAARSGPALLPVLAERKQAVDDMVDSLFVRLRESRSSAAINPDGWHAGRAAADLASLRHHTPLAGR